MVIERTADEVVVRIPVSPQTIDRVQDAVDYLRYIELGAGTSVSQDEVDELAREVKRGWREKYERRS